MVVQQVAHSDSLETTIPESREEEGHKGKGPQEGTTLRKDVSLVVQVKGR